MNNLSPALPRHSGIGSAKWPAKLSAVMLAMWALFCLPPLPCSAQAPKIKPKGERVGPNLVRVEYYNALDLFEDGQTEQAIIGFDAALQKSRTSKNQRGIDSIPPLVMLGECFWAQGRIGLAMEQYDAALAISAQCSKWTSMLSVKPTGKAEIRSREINWGGENRRGADFWNPAELAQIPIGGSDLLLEMVTPPASTSARLVPVDAVEILRCQSIALRRRIYLLGELASLNPLSPALPQAFLIPQNVPLCDTLKTSISLCQSLAKLPFETPAGVSTTIKGLVSLPAGQDYGLSAVALLTLCDLAIANNDLKSAQGFALEASLVAAQAEQMMHWEEAIELWSKCVIHSDLDQNAVARTLQQMSKYGTDRSRLVAIRCQVELVRQLALRGDVATMKRQSSVVTTMLLPKQVLLPKMEAVVDYAAARQSLMEGDYAVGLQKLEESLIPFVGDSNLDVGSPVLYQTRLLTRLMDQGIVTDEAGLGILSRLFQANVAGNWRTHIQEQLAFLIADKSDPLNLLVQRTIAGTNEEAKVAVIDLLFSERFRQESVLSGRLLEFRHIINIPAERFAEPVKSNVLAFQRQLGTVYQNAVQMRALVDNFASPNKLDTRRWTNEDSKKWEAAKKLATVQEALLWGHAVSPLHLPANFPPRLDLPKLDLVLRDDDAILLFAASEQSIKALMRVGSKWRAWSVGQEANWRAKLQSILKSIQDGQPTIGSTLESDLESFRKALIPDSQWEQLAASVRWVVIPDDELWLFPFELLLESTPTGKTPAIANHPIVYLPTLGSAPLLMQSKPSQERSTVLQTPSFLASKPDAQKTVSSRVVGMSGVSVVDTVGVQTAIPSRLLKTVTPVMISLLKTSWSDPNSIVLGIDTDLNESTLASWNQLPWGTPKHLWLMGSEFRPDAISSTGDAWRRLVWSLAAQGTEQMLVSRWAVGGESMVILADAMRDYGGSVVWSEAWQRAVASLWAEELSLAREVRSPKEFDAAEILSGELPLYWASYLNIGDSIE